MSARQVIAAILNSVDDIDQEVFVRILTRESTGDSVVAEQVAPIRRIGMKGSVCIESSEMLTQH